MRVGFRLELENWRELRFIRGFICVKMYHETCQIQINLDDFDLQEHSNWLRPPACIEINKRFTYWLETGIKNRG